MIRLSVFAVAAYLPASYLFLFLVLLLLSISHFSSSRQTSVVLA